MVRPKIPKNSKPLNLYQIIIYIGLLISFYFLLSYRLLEVPTGLTSDETAFGYNAILLSRTAHDENGVFMPLFVNSLNKSDWRQPVTQYFITLFIKIFGITLFNIRATSIIVNLFSATLLAWLVTKLFKPIYGYISFVLFIITPIVFMQSHLALDNIMPIPFTLLWLISLFQYQQNQNKKYLLLSGISLGISFYTYKGMRPVVPIWSILTCLYIFYLKFPFKFTNKNIISYLYSILYFIVGIAPFILAIPFIQLRYPGAIFGGSRPRFDNIFNFLYPYFSYFDPTFIFIKGDELLFHSTRIYGMVLLSTLPLFFIGIYQSVKKNKYWQLILVAYLSAPILMGLVESVHRASRIMCTIPIYCLLTMLGIYTVWQKKIIGKPLIILFFLLISINFASFVNYYWFTYPKFTENIFGNLNPYRSYQIFANQSKQLQLTPYIHQEVYNPLFYQLYFPGNPNFIATTLSLPKNGILLSHRENIPGLRKLNITLPYYHLHITQ